MPEKYHIPIKTAAPRFHPVGKYAVIEFREDCAGSCRACVKKTCVYHIFKDNVLHMAAMREPEYLYTCQSCFRCIQECTRGIFSRVINPDYRELGDRYWRAENIHSLWYQAHTGKIPVSGAGYRGPFAGEGFDGMWTDMSEIVRPTRDGIHGREYINTSIEISRRITPLAFDAEQRLAVKTPTLLEIPLPMVLRLPPNFAAGPSARLSVIKAAAACGTLMMLEDRACSPYLKDYADQIIPCLTKKSLSGQHDLIASVRALEIPFAAALDDTLDGIRAVNPDAAVIVRMPLDDEAPDRASAVAAMDVDALYFFADDHGRGLGGNPAACLRDLIRAVHLRLVDDRRRQHINLLFSGGIAMAEHMAKAIICGADGVVLGIPLLLALECRLCFDCRAGRPCPVALDETFDTQWGAQRIINLLGAWHSQLIEVMGAMGIRDVRRLRGEIGRSMWFDDLEKEHFSPVFGEKKRPQAANGG